VIATGPPTPQITYSTAKSIPSPRKIMSLKRKAMRRMLKDNENIIAEQNKDLLTVNQPGDLRPLNDYTDDVEQSAHVALNGEDIKSFVKTAMLSTSEDRE
jgi:hypothetical protein